MLNDLDTAQALVKIALAAFGTTGSIAAFVLTRWTGIAIEDRYVARIKHAITTVVTAAFADGKTDLKEITQLSIQYLAETLPTTTAKTLPTKTFVEAFVKSRMEDLINGN